MITIPVTNKQLENWLYYETGFEQCHPIPSIIEWMEKQGWEYCFDWTCKFDRDNIKYTLEFANEEMCSMFLLRWA